ncbi:MAG: thiamine phosphate synthase [Methylophilaceae bacterium]
MKANQIKGLYAITPDELDIDKLLNNVRSALKGGASVLQYRNKAVSKQVAFEQASLLLDLCHEYGTPFIINDDVELALKLDADGVHLGSSDGSLRDARKKLGDGKIIGASCYNKVEIAQFAQQNGVDYIAFGACFLSGTKPHAPKADLTLFTKAKATIHLPTVAIGGITYENASSVIAAGADSIAVIGALWNSDDIEQTAQQFTQLFNQ